jgi:replicative DNA helicase
MIQLQIINKILTAQSVDIIIENNLDESHFLGYEKEFSFIMNHYNKYKKIPDKATFLDNFREFSFISVTETDHYLVTTLMEEHTYSLMVPLLRKSEELIKNNSYDALEYLMHEMNDLMQKTSKTESTNIVSQAGKRYNEYKKRLEGTEPHHIASGFDELDTQVGGWDRKQELCILFARTGVGKSWIQTRSLMCAWQQGFRVGLISPEMNADDIGYRFDTLHQNFSNTSLVRGVEAPGYESYIEELKKNETPFIVATPDDFQKKVTVSKLKYFCIQHKLDILGIDGITYLQDERLKKAATKTEYLTNISEDLFALSKELQIPILVSVQANRNGADKKKKDEESEDALGLETIANSDGIAQNSTRVISIKQKSSALELCIKKNRYGRTGDKFLYSWNIDTGIFQYIPNGEANTDKEAVEKLKEEYNDDIQF